MARLKVEKVVLELHLVVKDENGNEIGHYPCNRGVAFRLFDDHKATQFVQTIQTIATTVGQAMGFTQY